MSFTGDPRDARIAELEQELAKVKEELAEAKAKIAEQAKVIKRLQAESAKERRSKRQAAPHSKDKKCTKPKRPGRKAGVGPFTNRQAPSDSEITERIEIELPEHCTCGGCVELEEIEEASTTDLPALPKPNVTLFRRSIGRCDRCGRVFRGTHPDLAPDQFGATAHRVGDRVMAAAHTLHYAIGVPVQKVPEVLKELTGITVTQSAITQDAMRRAEGEIGQEYEKLRQSIRNEPIAHTDDTGWRINGKPAQLMVFASANKTVFQIRMQHRNEEVREVIPADYKGVMVTDRGVAYDAKALDEVAQQKCMSHVQRSITKVLDDQVGAARRFGQTLKDLVSGAVECWHTYHEGNPQQFWEQAPKYKQEITQLLRPRILINEQNQTLLNELGWHNDRGNLLRFLDDPMVPPTNNLAERELRPGVIARKVSQCSKNDRGAYAHSAFSSVVRTLKRQGAPSITEALHSRFQVERHKPLQPTPES